MIDCTKCKHMGLQKVDECSIMYACDLDKLKDVGNGMKAMPDKCSDFEPISLTEEEKEVMKNLHTCLVEGLKYDEGKNRMGLVLQGFSNALWEVGRVGTFGCQKYGENQWQGLANGKARYLDALCRHLFKHLQGEKVDDESGLLHLSHLIWNALALLEFELKGKTDFKYKAPIDHVNDYIKTEEGAKKIIEIMKESEENNGIHD